ncbi:DUF2304 family protein [Blautia stercoris]
MGIFKLEVSNCIVFGKRCCVFIDCPFRKKTENSSEKMEFFGFYLVVILIIFSIFPRLAIWASYLTGVQSPANCVFYAYYFYIRMSPVLFIN